MFISGSEARALVAEGAQLVDVRGPHEYAADGAPGAVNIPLQALAQIARDMLSADKPVVVYCASGMRSAQAKNVLQQLGFSSVHNVCSARQYMS
ncbi:MAG: rhodanese-like domain-containing protein [Gammaproteobacteria bacterium]|nr:rhodanese-like domain-containing protein [Gammaproteobacteria bacterium]